MRGPTRLSRLIAALGILFGVLMISSPVAQAETVGGGRKFVRNTDAVVSPDGSRLAYVRDSGAGKNVWVLDLETGVSAPVARSEQDEIDPRWRGNDIVSYTLVAGESSESWEVHLWDGSTQKSAWDHPVETLDGTKRAYYQDALGIWVWEQGVAHDLLLRGSRDALRDYKWSPDNARLAYTGWMFAGDIRVHSLFVSALDGTDAVRVFPVVGSDYVAASKRWIGDYDWSPDSSSLVMSTAGPQGFGEVYVTAAGEPEMRPLGILASSVAWSPTGVIAFSGPEGIETIRPDGTGRAYLTGGSAVNAWSLDGSKLYFTRAIRAGSEIWMYDFVTGEECRLVK